MLLVSQAKIPLIVSQYIERFVVPKASGLLAAAAWGSIFLANKVISNFFKSQKNIDFLKASEIMNEDGNIDIDKAHEVMKFVIEKTQKLEIMGWVIDANDIEEIHRIAKDMV